MATEEDAEEILNIYAPYITKTAITFEYDVPSVDAFSRRIRDVLQMYPYIVALEKQQIVGYAYASAFAERAAYNWAVETSIYLRQDCKGNGFGKRLYLALEDILHRQGILNLNACIAYTPVADTRLNNASAAFHEHLGYKKVAYFTRCGYKFGTWYDMVWMEKMLGEHPKKPKPIVPITELPVFSLGS